MTKIIGNIKQHDTSRKTSNTKHQITTNNTMDNGGKIWLDTPNPNTWYRFMDTDGQKWVVFDGNLILKRDAILDSFFTKFKTQSPWRVDGMDQEKRKGGVRYAITEILQFWDLDSLNFHFNLEDKLRQSKISYNSKKLKIHYQTAIRMATTAHSDIPDYRKYTEEGGTYDVLPMSIVTEFWISAVNTFGGSYEVVFQSVYSRTGKYKLTPQATKKCVTKFLESFPRIVPFPKLTLFDEVGTGDHDICNKVAKTMNGGSSLDNWEQSWNLLLSKNEFDDTETTLLMLGIRLASSSPEIHQGWIGDALPSITITDAWVGTGEVFGELRIQDTVMEEADTVLEDVGTETEK